MKGRLLWMLLITVSLTTAATVTRFEASCANGWCYGDAVIDKVSEFAFDGPYPSIPARFEGLFAPDSVDFGIGTNGGYFGLPNDGSCDYSVLLGGGFCDAAVWIAGSANITGLPFDDIGHSIGYVFRTGADRGASAHGHWCIYSDPRYGSSDSGGCGSFDLPQVLLVTSEFTLTNPGTEWPWTWTRTEYSFETPTPEPGTGLFTTPVLLTFAAAAFRGRQRYRRG